MIGLIFGKTDFPKKILKKIKNKKKYIIIDLTKNNLFKKDKNSYSVSISQFGKIIDILKKNKCKKVLFAGSVERPNFSKLRFDFKGIFYLPKIIKSAKIGDASLLKEIINIFKKEKIETISSLSFTPQLSLKRGIHTSIKPNILDRQDIKKAVSCLNKQGSYSYVQAAVSRNRKIIAIESKMGTKKMLQKIKKINNRKIGVLAKFPKKKTRFKIRPAHSGA